VTRRSSSDELRFNHAWVAFGCVLVVALLLLGLGYLNRKRLRDREQALREKLCRPPSLEIRTALADLGSLDAAEIDGDHRLWSLLEDMVGRTEDGRQDARVMKETQRGWLVWHRWSKKPTLEVDRRILALVEQNGCGSEVDDGTIRVAYRTKTDTANAFLIVVERRQR
jgi:hypothetical protein